MYDKNQEILARRDALIARRELLRENKKGISRTVSWNFKAGRLLTVRRSD